MSLAPLERVDVEYGLETIDHLDFDPSCEHSQHHTGRWGHSGPAWALVEALPHSCGREGAYLYVCRGAWEFQVSTGAGFACRVCSTATSFTETWRFIALVRP